LSSFQKILLSRQKNSSSCVNLALAYTKVELLRIRALAYLDTLACIHALAYASVSLHILMFIVHVKL